MITFNNQREKKKKKKKHKNKSHQPTKIYQPEVDMQEKKNSPKN